MNFTVKEDLKAMFHPTIIVALKVGVFHILIPYIREKQIEAVSMYIENETIHIWFETNLRSEISQICEDLNKLASEQP
jgi:hypothetical protein